MVVEMLTTKPPFWDCEPVAALFKIGAEGELDLRELIPNGMFLLWVRQQMQGIWALNLILAFRCFNTDVPLEAKTFLARCFKK